MRLAPPTSRRRPVVLGFAGATLAALMLALPVSAWTQLRNNWPDSPVSCDGSASYPCIRWPKTTQNLSIHVDVYPDPDFDIFSEVDMFSILTGSRQEWNGAPARNPFYDQGGVASEVSVYPEGLPFAVAGRTTVYANAGSSYKIWRADVRMSSNVLFNTSFDWGCGDYCIADARSVMTHELGHSQALGHTSVSANAIMKTMVNFPYWKPQNNDGAGLQAIYGAYP